MGRYDKMTDAEFDRILAEIMDENPASALLSVPGVYEAVKEEFNNAVLSQWEEENPEDEETVSA